jgi:hypothetical protein
MSITSNKISVTLPKLGLIAITRVALGIRIGLLISNGLKKGAAGGGICHGRGRLAYDQTDSIAAP